jgi:hypothetical protein
MGSFARRSSIPKTLRGKETVNARNIFGELKRRNIYKVAVAYAVVCETWRSFSDVLPFGRLWYAEPDAVERRRLSI